MDMFRNAMALRLQSHYGKFLTADKDEVSVYQDSNGSSNSARWTVEFVEGTDNVIRLKSCYNKYLTASNLPFLLKMTGLKVLQTLPTGRLDSSVKWEPVREGNRVKLRTRHGNLLRADGGVPLWRNSVTHNAHDDKTSTKDHLLWYVNFIATHPPRLKLPTRTDPFGDLVTRTESNSPPIIQWSILRRQESSDSLDDLSAAAKVSEGRKIYYQVADEYGNVDISVTECQVVPISDEFSLHGLWPQNYAGTGREIFPSYCSTDVPYKVITDQDLFVKLNIYWPDLREGRRYNQLKWGHVWRKHGTCSLIWYYQNEYFTLAMRLFEQFDVLGHLIEKGIVPANDHTYSVERIRLGIRELTTKEPDLYCHINNDRQKQLLEIRLCYSPGGDIMDCEPASLAHTCSDPQVLFPARPVPPN